MNIGSRKCGDILKFVSNHVHNSRIIIQHANKSVSIHRIDFRSIRQLHQNHFPSKNFLIDDRVGKLFPRFYADYPRHKVITLPNLSPTMETGAVLSWGRAEGEAVSEGDLLAEIETDKATMSMDASDSGFLAKILVKAGTRDIPIGTPLCVIVEDESDVAAFADFAVSASAKPVSAPKAVEKPPEKPPAPKPTPVIESAPQAIPPQVERAAPIGGSESRVFASPLARTLARERNIDLNQLGIVGSGPDGRIRAIDVDQYCASGAPARTSPGTGVDKTLSADRGSRAERSLQSKLNAPHFYLQVDVRIDRALQLRSNTTGKKPTDKSTISLNDIAVKAAAVACLRVPQCNSSWGDGFIRQYNNVDIDVVIPSENGNDNVMTVNVANADSKGLKQINSEIRNRLDQASQKAKSQSPPQQNQIGTFTVSNMGVFGITSFTPIITLPQACVLAIGGRQERLIYDDSTDTKFSKATFMSVTLCCDHRVVDGAVGAQWLKEFKENMEDPANMLL